MPLSGGQTFAGYRIVRLLGSGGMGEVYLVQHPRLPRKDALKVLAAEVSANAEYRARFNLEADLASELYHPHIVGVHDRGEDDGRLWISMDYVDGFDTARLLADKYRHGMPAHQVTKIVTAVASALDYAHDRNLLHRDVKPANIMLTDDKSEQRILLADFGIARSLNTISGLTATGYTVGTVAYAAPEQLMGQEIDGRADQYALAATAYHLLTGSQLFPHSLGEKPVGDAAIDSIFATALAKTPNERFPRCTDFARALTLAQIDRRTSAAGMKSGQGTTQPRTRAKSPNATRPTTSETPTASQDDSVYTPYDGKDGGGRRARWPITIGIVMVLFLLAIALFVRPWQQQDRSASGNTSTATSPAPAITFDGMRGFVEGYYADLPARPNDAWKKVDAHWQNQTGQRDFLDFWATIQSVTLVSVRPRDATSVVARVRYVPRIGQSSTEDRWLKMALVNGVMMLDESGRIGPASDASTPPESSPTSVDTVLLTTDEMSSQLGVKVTDSVTGGGSAALKMDASSYGTSDHSTQVTPPSCAGVVFTAEQNAYGSTDFQKIKTQTFSTAPMAQSATGPESVEQTAAIFPSADSAGKFVDSAQNQWNVCARSRVDVVLGFENGRGFTLGNVQRQGDVLTVPMASWGGLNGLHACQQALGARSNVVVATRTCEQPSVPGYRPGDQVNPAWAVLDAERLARAMLDKVKT